MRGTERVRGALRWTGFGGSKMDGPLSKIHPGTAPSKNVHQTARLSFFADHDQVTGQTE